MRAMVAPKGAAVGLHKWKNEVEYGWSVVERDCEHVLGSRLVGKDQEKGFEHGGLNMGVSSEGLGWLGKT